MSESGSANIGDDARVYGPVTGKNEGQITATYNIKHEYHGDLRPPPLDEATLAAQLQA